MNRQQRPDITFDLTVKIYRKAEDAIGTLTGLSMLVILIGVGLSVIAMSNRASLLQIILVGIWPVISGIFLYLIFSAVEAYIKATRCKFMVENNHLRDLRVDNN